MSKNIFIYSMFVALIGVLQTTAYASALSFDTTAQDFTVGGSV